MPVTAWLFSRREMNEIRVFPQAFTCCVLDISRFANVAHPNMTQRDIVETQSRTCLGSIDAKEIVAGAEMGKRLDLFAIVFCFDLIRYTTILAGTSGMEKHVCDNSKLEKTYKKL